jgi:3-oxoacyl-[acyl-carrier protein] reductase
LVRAYSRKLAPKILVNGLAPGIINTKMPKDLIKERGDDLLKQIPQKRFGEPEEVASVIMFLLSQSSSYINGQIINVDGGIINS